MTDFDETNDAKQPNTYAKRLKDLCEQVELVKRLVGEMTSHLGNIQWLGAPELTQ